MRFSAPTCVLDANVAITGLLQSAEHSYRKQCRLHSAALAVVELTTAEQTSNLAQECTVHD